MFGSGIMLSCDFNTFMKNNLKLILIVSLTTFGDNLCSRAADPQTAISIQETTIVVNGSVAATIQAGVNVIVLGEKADSSELIVQCTLNDGQKVVGLVPKTAVVLSKSIPSPSPLIASKAVQSKSNILSALEISKEAKDNRDAFAAKYSGQQIRIFGSIEKATIENMSGSSEKQPVLTLATMSGLPKVKVRLSPSIAKSSSIISDYKYFPSWLYGYYGRKLEFRQSGINQLQVRSSYKSSSSYSNGSTFSSRHSSDWSPIFSPGDPITIEGFVKGIGLDIELEGAFLIAPSK
jgi:hypothetical protein